MVGHLRFSSIFNSFNKNRLKGFSPGQLVIGRDMILLIKHKVDWGLIRQQKQSQIDKYNTRKNNKIVEHD